MLTFDDTVASNQAGIDIDESIDTCMDRACDIIIQQIQLHETKHGIALQKHVEQATMQLGTSRPVVKRALRILSTMTGEIHKTMTRDNGAVSAVLHINPHALLATPQ